MTIAVLGADGRSGQAFVKAALEAGHTVRAGGLASAWAGESHDKLSYAHCDATSQADLFYLLNGCNAVVSLIGHIKGSSADVQSAAMQSLVDVMQALEISRLVSLTGTGVREPGDKISFMDWFLNVGVKIVDPKRVHDGVAHAEIIKKSPLDWTIIRVLKLTDNPAQAFSLTEHGPAKSFVSRTEVASAILQTLDSSDFIKRSPIISNL